MKLHKTPQSANKKLENNSCSNQNIAWKIKMINLKIYHFSIQEIFKNSLWAYNYLLYVVRGHDSE